jgi:hypothetical protein
MYDEVFILLGKQLVNRLRLHSVDAVSLGVLAPEQQSTLPSQPSPPRSNLLLLLLGLLQGVWFLLLGPKFAPPANLLCA